MAMDPEQVEGAISFLTGEVHALLMFSQALARTHPAPTLLLAGLDTIEQKGVAQIGGTLVVDATIDGFRFAVDALRTTVLAAQGS
jgi:hypothetical protein